MNYIRINLAEVFFVLFILVFSSTICCAIPDPEETQGHSTIRRAVNIEAPMPGKLVELFVVKGQQVKSGDLLCVLEAMKMSHSIYSTSSGEVGDVLFKVGSMVSLDALLICLLPSSPQEAPPVPSGKQSLPPSQEGSFENHQRPHVIVPMPESARLFSAAMPPVFSPPPAVESSNAIQKKQEPQHPLGTAGKSSKARQIALPPQWVRHDNKSMSILNPTGVSLANTMPTAPKGSVLPKGKLFDTVSVGQGFYELNPQVPERSLENVAYSVFGTLSSGQDFCEFSFQVPAGSLQNVTYGIESSNEHQKRPIKQNHRQRTQDLNNKLDISMLPWATLICALIIFSQLARSWSRKVNYTAFVLLNIKYLCALDFTKKIFVINNEAHNLNSMNWFNKQAA